MQTFTGKRFYPLDPRPEDFDIIDIAHALSHICRYGGHCDRLYSVAEHSMFVSIEAGTDHALAGLMHDATEAYVVDLPRPLKQALTQYGSDGYEQIEQNVWSAIAQRYELPFELPREVKEADFSMLGLERQELMPRAEEWDVPMPRMVKRLMRLSPFHAAMHFLSMYSDLSDTDCVADKYSSLYRARGWDGVTITAPKEAA